MTTFSILVKLLQGKGRIISRLYIHQQGKGQINMQNASRV